MDLSSSQLIEYLIKVGITISTIGNVTTRYDCAGRDGQTEIYIPVFEGQEFRFSVPEHLRTPDFSVLSMFALSVQ